MDILVGQEAILNPPQTQILRPLLGKVLDSLHFVVGQDQQRQTLVFGNPSSKQRQIQQLTHPHQIQLFEFGVVIFQQPPQR
jgi:hypothetical protein